MTDQTDTGPEPPYARPNPYLHPSSPDIPFYVFDIAYETWGTLSPAKDNVILLHTVLLASSHAASTSLNPAPGWWEKLIGPEKTLDANQFFTICINILGGCYGSTEPSSIEADTDEPWATTFPILSIFDMVRGYRYLVFGSSLCQETVCKRGLAYGCHAEPSCWQVIPWASWEYRQHQWNCM